MLLLCLRVLVCCWQELHQSVVAGGLKLSCRVRMHLPLPLDCLTVSLLPTAVIKATWGSTRHAALGKPIGSTVSSFSRSFVSGCALQARRSRSRRRRQRISWRPLVTRKGRSWLLTTVTLLRLFMTLPPLGQDTSRARALLCATQQALLLVLLLVLVVLPAEVRCRRSRCGSSHGLRRPRRPADQWCRTMTCK